MARLASLAALVIVAVSFGARAEPLSDADADRLREAIEKNWLVPIGLDNIESCTVTLRLHLAADGGVSNIERLADNGGPGCDTIAESARRAVLITQSDLGRLPIPADKYNSTVDVRWSMKLICEQVGGC
jgi:hypothetical protein